MSKLFLQHPQRLKNGAYFSNISNDDKSQIIITTPTLKVVSDGVIQGTRYNYVEVELSSENPKQKSFVEKIENIELSTKERIIEKRSAWFYEDIDADDIHYFFQSSLRNVKGETGKYTIRIIVGKRNMGRTTWESTIYDESDVIKSTNDLKKGTHIAVAILCKGLHFTSSSFSIEFIGNELLMLNEEPVTIVSRELLKQYADNGEREVERQRPLDSNDVSMNKSTDSTESMTDVSGITPITSSPLHNDEVPTTQTEESENLSKKVSNDVDISNNQGEIIDTSGSLVTMKVDTEEQRDISQPTNVIVEGEQVNENDTTDTHNTNSTNITDSTEITKEVNDNDENIIEELREVDIQPDESDSIDIRKPAEVFFEIYKEALTKARRAKEKALMAYLEALNIKNTYLVGETIPSDELDSVISSLDGSDGEEEHESDDESDGEEVRVSGVLKEIDNLSDMDEGEIRDAIVSSQ